MDRKRNQPIASNVALAKLRDLAPNWSEEKLLQMVLERSTMQWKLLSDDKLTAMLRPMKTKWQVTKLRTWLIIENFDFGISIK
jgi:hypothetical protein